MSTVICLKEADALILATDSKFTRPDGVTVPDAQKIFEIAPQTFIAPSGWKMAADYQVGAARDLVGSVGTDIRRLVDELTRWSIPRLEGLVDILRASQNEKVQQALAGKLMLHVTVLAGRTGQGELGYVVMRYRVQDGKVTCEQEEYFGSDFKLYVSAGDPANLAVQADPGILDGAPLEVVQKMLAALKRACPSIGGADQIVSIDGSGTRWISQCPAAAEADSLCTSNALFAGNASFARVGGGKLDINSSGIAIGDTVTSPNSTMTVTSGGATIAHGSNSLQMNALGMSMTDGSGNSLLATSTGVLISRGSSSVNIGASVVTITQGILTLNTNGATTKLNNDNGTGYPKGIDTQDNTSLIRSYNYPQGFYVLGNGTSGFPSVELSGAGTPSTPNGTLLLRSGTSSATALVVASGSDASVTMSNGSVDSVLSSAGLSRYSGAFTDGMGVPPIYAAVSLTGQSGSIGATSLRVGGSIAPAGLYRVSWYGKTTTASGSDTLTVTISYNDGTGSRTRTFGFALGSTSASGTQQIVDAILTDGSTDITYSTNRSGATGSPQYALKIALERIV